MFFHKVENKFCYMKSLGRLPLDVNGSGHNPIFRLVMYTTAKLGYALSQLVA